MVIGWEEVELNSLSDGGMQNGVFLEVSRKGTGIPIINVSDMYKRAPITSETLALFDSNEEEINRFNVKNGDLFFTRSSIVPKGIAHCNWYKQTKHEYVLFDSHVIRFKTDLKKVLPMYLYLQCISSKARDYFISNSNTGTMTTIDQASMGKCLISLAPFHEQLLISTSISDIDGYIAALEKLIAKKQNIKKGVMQELLTGRRQLPGFENEWYETTLGEIALDIRTGKRNNEEKVENGKYAFFVRSQQVERINDYSFDCEAILIPGEGNIGQIFHYINGKFDCHQRVYKISNFTGVNARFLFYYLSTFFGKHALKNTVKATVDSLRLPTFLDFTLRLPVEEAEQSAIVEVLSCIDTELQNLTLLFHKAQEIKQGMMQELLTGRIRLVKEDELVDTLSAISVNE